MFYFEVSVVSILNFSSSFPQMLWIWQLQHCAVHLIFRDILRLKVLIWTTTMMTQWQWHVTRTVINLPYGVRQVDYGMAMIYPVQHRHCRKYQLHVSKYILGIISEMFSFLYSSARNGNCFHHHHRHFHHVLFHYHHHYHYHNHGINGARGNITI